MNNAAKALTPPRPTISAAEILDKTFLSEFDLLRDSRHQVQTKPWAQPATRLVIDQYFRLVRAKEEVERLNIEMRRMRTWIRDNETHMKAVLERLRLEDVDLAYEVQLRLRTRSLAHLGIEKQFKEVEGFLGFTGIKTCGIGRYSANSTSAPDDSPVVNPPVVANPLVVDPAIVSPTPPTTGNEEDAGDNTSEHSLDEEEQAEVDAIDTEFGRDRD